MSISTSIGVQSPAIYIMCLLYFSSHKMSNILFSFFSRSSSIHPFNRWRVDYNNLTSLMKEISLKIVNNGGIVRSIQNHGVRQLPHRFRAKYADRDGNRYYEKGRFISVFYDANPTVMREVEGILNLDEQILRNTHLKARNKFLDVNNVREKKNPYIQELLKEDGS